MGEYFTIHQMLLREGGPKGMNDRTVVSGVMKAVNKCTAMGAPWVQLHPQTGRVMYLYRSYRISEQFSEYWDMFTDFLDEVPAKTPVDKKGSEASSSAADPPLPVDDQPLPQGADDGEKKGRNKPRSIIRIKRKKQRKFFKQNGRRLGH